MTGVFVHAVLGSLRRRARLHGASGGRGGAVAIIQRFGAALNLNIHVHALVLDLARRGLAAGDDGNADRWSEESPVLAGIAAASVQGRLALGERAGATVRRGGASADLLALAASELGPCHARRNGFDVHAGVVVPPRDRARSRITASDRASSPTSLAVTGDHVLPTPTDGSKRNWLWAKLMQRSFGFDVLACPRCGDRLELIALIDNPPVIRRILSHLGLPTEVPAARPARPPPVPTGRAARWSDDVAAP